MTDEQLKEITDRLDKIASILEETFKSMNKNSLAVQKAIHTASDGIQGMQLIAEPPSAMDIGDAVARALKK